MSQLPSRVARGALFASFALALLSFPAIAKTPRVHAIVGARIVAAPGQVIERGTIVMRDGVITSVGAGVPVPADARVWEGDSLTIYPGLIDAFVMPAEAPGQGAPPGPPFGRPRTPATPAPSRGAAHALSVVRAEMHISETQPLAKDQAEGLRAAGFAAAQVAPRIGIVRGQSAVVGLAEGDPNDVIVKADAAQVVALEASREGYPGSLMGAIAVIRQVFMDARWYRDALATYLRAPAGKERPETNLSWEALQAVIAGRQPALFVADEMLEVLRSTAIAREAGVTAQVVGAGDEYKRVKEIAAAGVPLIVPVNFPEAPELADPDAAVDVSTEELRHWNQAPENPATLAKNGVAFALTANGLKDVKSFRANVGKAIERGLKPDQALAAVTTTPARLLGLSDRLGTLAAGKIANLTVTRGELFSEKGKVTEVWVDGARYEVSDPPSASAKGNWNLAWDGARHALMVEVDKDTAVRLVVGADTLKADRVRFEGSRVVFTVRRGSEPAETFDLTANHDILRGTLAVGTGSHKVVGVKQPDDDKGGGGPMGTRPPGGGPPREGMAAGGGPGGPPGGPPRAAEAKPKDEPVVTPVVMGNTEAWRMAAPAQPAAVLVKNATLWTAGPQGTLQNADLLVRAGKIAAVGKNFAAPSGAVVIDAAGRHVAPGIIDEHSHAAVLGNVNECTNSVTCEVRIQDVVNSESVNIYRQLAGGTTIMHLLHGSCNAIGGQLSVIKNKWGAPPDQLLMPNVPPTVKFALGENPKQSNWGAQRPDPPRYPQSRAGVEQVIRDAFTRARDYKAQWAEWNAKHQGLPPRRDIQLDALAEMIDGRMKIHCHSYRQDEILMLMRLTEDFGFRVNTFTHILEGYKVADEMATHGASAMGFSDWWGYKFEVIDAIPYSGYIMWDRGVNTGFNSDDSELARRLNTEAAKAIKYGGVPPEEAIKFVTLNPAKSLEIDDRVGSLEVGKDADFSIWNGSPLSPYSVCQQTWIEGRKYFDRAEDLAGRAALAKERDALVARVKAQKKDAAPAGPAGGRRMWPPRYLEATDMSGTECGLDGHDALPFMSETQRRALQNGEVQR
jgi:imidazolonepropionase-like amidohydrolase